MPNESLTEKFFIHAFAKRFHLFDDTLSNCFRVFHGPGDGVNGLTIDMYNEYLLVQYFDRSIIIDDALKSVIIKAANEFPQPIRGILIKNRIKETQVKDFHELRKSELLFGELPETNYLVKQNDVTVDVDLINGQSTGLFLDMREVRNALQSIYSPDMFLLNLFSYTGIFSIHALLCGIKSAINVDLSSTVLKRAKNNYVLNNLNYDERDFIAGDAPYWVRRLQRMNKKFSFIVLDPPTFSRNKNKSFSVKKDYSKVLHTIHEICDGYVLSSINSYSVTEKEYRNYHPSSWKLELFMNESEDFTHQGNPYLKVGLWKVF